MKMVVLTHDNEQPVGDTFMVNPLQVTYVYRLEPGNKAIVHLTDGSSWDVQESMQEVFSKINKGLNNE